MAYHGKKVITDGVSRENYTKKDWRHKKPSYNHWFYSYPRCWKNWKKRSNKQVRMRKGEISTGTCYRKVYDIVYLL